MMLTLTESCGRLGDGGGDAVDDDDCASLIVSRYGAARRRTASEDTEKFALLSLRASKGGLALHQLVVRFSRRGCLWRDS